MIKNTVKMLMYLSKHGKSITRQEFVQVIGIFLTSVELKIKSSCRKWFMMKLLGLMTIYQNG